MTVQSLNFLIQLMLAQAQACFYEKSVKDQMQSAIKAKLAHQAVEFYASALDFARSRALASVLDPGWCVNLDFQRHCLLGASQYWQAQASKAKALDLGSGYGEEIARYRVARKSCEAATKVAKIHQLPSVLCLSIQQLGQLIEAQCKAAEKDNHTIYMERIPVPDDLPVIGKACLVKSIPIENQLSNESLEEDLFPGLMTTRVRKVVSELKAQVSELEQASVKNCTSKKTQATAQLNAWGLPGTLQAYESPEIPDTLWQKIQHCRSFSSVTQSPPIVSEVETLVKENETQVHRITQVLFKEIKFALETEQTHDKVGFDTYGPKWRNQGNNVSSEEINRGFFNDLERYQGLVEQAKKSDKILQNQLDQHQDAFIALLSNSKSEFDAMLPKGVADGSSNSNTYDPVHLSQSLCALAQVLATRQTQLDALSTDCRAYDPVPVRISQTFANTPDLCPKAFVVAALEPIRARARALESTFDLQDTLVGKIEIQNAEFQKCTSSNALLLERGQVLNTLEAQVLAYEECLSRVKEGHQFYLDLTERVRQCRQTVLDHCSARTLQQRELELYLEHQAPVDASAGLVQSLERGRMDLNNPPPSSSQLDSDAAFAATLAAGASQHFDTRSPGVAPVPTAPSLSHYPGAGASGQSSTNRYPQQQQPTFPYQQHYPYQQPQNQQPTYPYQPPQQQQPQTQQPYPYQQPFPYQQPQNQQPQNQQPPPPHYGYPPRTNNNHRSGV